MGHQVESGLIPARFLTLIAHLVVLIIVLCAREENVLASMPMDYTSQEFQLKDTQLVIGLGTALALIGIELFGFLSGISMFMSIVGAVSTLCHGLGSVLLALAVLDSWESSIFWWIFSSCSILPAFVEITATFMQLYLQFK